MKQTCLLLMLSAATLVHGQVVMDAEQNNKVLRNLDYSDNISQLPVAQEKNGKVISLKIPAPKDGATIPASEATSTKADTDKNSFKFAKDPSALSSDEKLLIRGAQVEVLGIQVEINRLLALLSKAEERLKAALGAAAAQCGGEVMSDLSCRPKEEKK